MRQAGMTLVAVAALMAMGAPIAEAGMTCKIIPSWCPGGDSSQGVNNKSQKVGFTQHGGTSSPGDTNTDTGSNNGSNGLVFNHPGLSNPSPPGNDGSPQNNSQGGNNQGGDSQGDNGPGTSNPSLGNNNPGSSNANPGAPTPTGVPEPATLLLLGIGASAAGAATFRRRKKD
jgi:PEP-CTERM motif